MRKLQRNFGSASARRLVILVGGVASALGTLKTRARTLVTLLRKDMCCHNV
jgi:hypothetical protein